MSNKIEQDILYRESIANRFDNLNEKECVCGVIFRYYFSFHRRKRESTSSVRKKKQGSGENCENGWKVRRGVKKYIISE